MTLQTLEILSNSLAMEQVSNLHEFVLLLLEDPDFGLRNACMNNNEFLIVDVAIALIRKTSTSQEVDYGVWTELKTLCFAYPASPVADCISRICSAYRNPKQAGLSGLRDAISKLLEAHEKTGGIGQAEIALVALSEAIRSFIPVDTLTNKLRTYID